MNSARDRSRIPAVMISSTMDLIEEREIVRKAAHDLGVWSVSMEDDLPRANDKVSESLGLVDRATLYVAIIGPRPSSVADGYEKSMVELEYERAVRRRIDRRIFIRAYPQDAVAMLDPRVQAFRARLNDDGTTRPFTSIDDLRDLVIDAIREHRRLLLGLPSETGRAKQRLEIGAARSAEIDTLLATSSPDNYLLASNLIAQIVELGIPTRQLCAWLDQIDWRMVLRQQQGAKGDRPAAGQRYVSPMATAICDLHLNLRPDAWQPVRRAIASAMAATRRPEEREFCTQLLRAIALLNDDTARDLLDGNELLSGQLSDSQQTIIARGELMSLLAPTGAGLRIGLDAWPGYFPLFAIEDQLQATAGISLLDVESSREKLRLLHEKRIDLLATTPGCLLGLNDTDLSHLRVVAVLNQSSGADQILIRGTQWSKNDSRWPEADVLASATWIVTAGSTSELFAKTLCRRLGIMPKPPQWWRTADYHDALEAMRGTSGVTICSTWEPYSSWMRQQDPTIGVLCTTADFAPLVVDCLVTTTNRDGKEIDNRVRQLLELWDDCLARRLYLEPARISTVCGRFVRFEPEDYHRMIGGVRFMDSSEMRARSTNGEFEAVLDRVWAGWGREGEPRPQTTTWHHLVHDAATWPVARANRG